MIEPMDEVVIENNGNTQSIVNVNCLQNSVLKTIIEHPNITIDWIVQQDD